MSTHAECAPVTSSESGASSRLGSPAGNLLVLGLGNDILTDDAVGLRIAREMKAQLTAQDQFEVRETLEMGLALLDMVTGFDHLLLIDAIQTGRAKPGTVYEFTLEDLPKISGVGPHFLGVAEVFELGRCLGLHLPRTARIYAIEVADPFTVGIGMTEAVRLTIPQTASRILADARHFSAPATSSLPA